jgi:hypothetical protein
LLKERLAEEQRLRAEEFSRHMEMVLQLQLQLQARVLQPVALGQAIREAPLWCPAIAQGPTDKARLLIPSQVQWSGLDIERDENRPPGAFGVAVMMKCSSPPTIESLRFPSTCRQTTASQPWDAGELQKLNLSSLLSP